MKRAIFSLRVVYANSISAGISILKSRFISTAVALRFGCGTKSQRLMLSRPGLRTRGASNLTTGPFPSSRKVFAMLFALFILGVSLPGFAQTNYYVDPDYAGGTRNGNASNPWHSLNDSVTNAAWTVINNSLASGPVNVYFSARKAASNTNQTSTDELVVQRTNGS